MSKIESLDNPALSKEMVGNKGYNLSCMRNIPSIKNYIPEGFVLTTEVFEEYGQRGQLPEEEISQAYYNLGLPPPAVSVRSSAAVSMPGMMQTVLDITDLPNLYAAIRYVLDSWYSPNAKAYRKLHDISDSLGTAVVVQRMVYGDLGKMSGTGVVFTRNPNTGDRELYGEFLRRARGEAIVSGTVTPHPIGELRLTDPAKYSELKVVCRVLEKHFKDMQDVEFTIEQSRLYILQTRAGKRTALARARIALDLFRENILTKKQAKKMGLENGVADLKQYRLPSKGKVYKSISLFGIGNPVSGGVVRGEAVLTAERAAYLSSTGRHPILIRTTTSPDDLEGMFASDGLVTAVGGTTSHAAVVARSLNKPCICGMSFHFYTLKDYIQKGDLLIRGGDQITLDANTGRLYLGYASRLIKTGVPQEVQLLKNL